MHAYMYAQSESAIPVYVYLFQYSYVRFRHKAFYISDSDIGAHPTSCGPDPTRENGARSYAEGWVSASRCKRKQAKRITFEASR